MMIKSKFVLDDVGVQLETHDEGLYVSFYLDAEYGNKRLCWVPVSYTHLTLPTNREV